MAKPISLAAYARHRGVSREAVSRAVKKGRLRESIDRTGGSPRVADVELADREWDATSDYTRASASAVERASAHRGEQVEYSLANESAREKHWKANLAELEYNVRAGELVPVAEVEDRYVDAVTAAKTKLLGIPTRIQQRLPHVAAEDVRVIDDLVREALEDMAYGR